MNERWAVTRRSVVAGLAANAMTLSLAGVNRARGDIDKVPELHWRGARVPSNLEQRVRIQNASAARQTEVIASDKQLTGVLKSAHGDFFKEVVPPDKFDWRTRNRVTPVKNQGSCGSCWVFAGIAAYESAYLIANNKGALNAYGYPSVYVSEQEALDCSNGEMDCVTGGWHEAVFLNLGINGEISGWYDDNASVYTYPYNAVRGFCTSKLDNRPYFVLNWAYVADGATIGHTVMPTDLALKAAILKYGPVVTSVITKGWEGYTQKYADGTQNQNWATDYPNAVFRGVQTANCDIKDINHEVAIVGWNNDLGVWLIKNSWGTDWGDKGYVNLSYGSNYIGYGASWVVATPAGSISKALARRLGEINRTNPLRQFYPALVG